MKIKRRVSEAGVQELGFNLKGQDRPAKMLSARWRHLANEELRAYFSGRLRSFAVPCDPAGLPPFTRSALPVRSAIPCGQVRSYRWVAERLGNAGASRAVGNALAKNPLPIIIPCQRGVCSDGQLGGFALGGRWKKRLLQVEKRPDQKNISSARSR